METEILLRSLDITHEGPIDGHYLIERSWLQSMVGPCLNNSYQQVLSILLFMTSIEVLLLTPSLFLLGSYVSTSQT